LIELGIQNFDQKTIFDFDIKMQKFQIAFFSSSDFCIPIAQNIRQSEGKSLLEVCNEQLLDLKSEDDYSVIFPSQFDIRGIQELHLPIELSIIVSQPDSDNRGKLIPNPVSKWAREKNLTLFTPESFNRSKNELQTKVDLSITASFGQIISEDSLNWAKNGFLNWHPSLLPQYRGATPIQSAIKNGDTESGLSWINMTKGLDEGDIFVQLKTNIEKDNFSSLSQRLGELGSRTWAIAVVNKLLNKKLEQDSELVSFCGKLSKDDRILKPEDKTAQEIFDQFRAYNIFPGTSFVDGYFEEEIKIIECSVPHKEEKNYLEPSYQKEIVLSSETNSPNQPLALTIINNWLIAKENKQQKVFLICKDNSPLKVSKIKLSTGKQIDLSGYQFKIK
jgi:methionyl-tRNA formyltransferase